MHPYCIFDFIENLDGFNVRCFGYLQTFLNVSFCWFTVWLLKLPRVMLTILNAIAMIVAVEVLWYYY